MSTEDVELRDSNVSSEPQKRRRSVHFDSCAKTVLVPGESEDADLRGRGTGHFSDHEEELIKKEFTSATLPPTIADETAAVVRNNSSYCHQHQLLSQFSSNSSYFHQ